MTFDFEAIREASRKEAEERIANFDPDLDLDQLAEENFPGGASQAVIATVHRLIPNIRAEAEHADDDRKRMIYRLCAQALRTVYSLDHALHPDELLHPSGRKDTGWHLWWHHGEPTGKVLDEVNKWPDKDRLQTAAADYLSCPWMRHPHIDWCIIDALVWWEWAAFTLRLSGTISALRFTLVVVSAVAYVVPQAINLIHGKQITWWPAIVIAFIWYAVPVFVCYINTPLRFMKRTYQELDGVVLNPTQACAHLHTAEKEGVVWPTTVWPVIDSVTARDPRMWNTG
jgi:hypothetical protein